MKNNENSIIGYIEGYYGRLLSWENRELIIKSLHKNKMNTYFYAPKEDICHRLCWRKKYSKNVPLVEIEKFHRDMALEVNKDVDCGVLISLDSGICAKEDFSIEFVAGKPVIYLHHTRNQMEHIQLAFTLFKIILRQEGLDTNMETAIAVFKGLAKKLKRNYKKQKTIIDKYHAEQVKILLEQQEHNKSYSSKHSNSMDQKSFDRNYLDR